MFELSLTSFGSSPKGQVRRLQSNSVQPSSHAHPKILCWSHSEYVVVRRSAWPLSCSAASLIDMHTPWPLQSLPDSIPPGHRVNSHAEPIKPARHLHTPVARSHVPMLEHSAIAWAVSTAVEKSAHAVPLGQFRREQSAPACVCSHTHVLFLVQTPFLEHPLGHVE